ncbi:cobalt-precorrin 5A hydrolase [Rhizobium sp. RU35A]|uniref:Cobalamin biosynthesis protein n=1 Tax=Rhizobium straminoryzae TaxID=1387186 RepID=A0A549T5A6_9HYPH|nr:MULTISPECIES: cobalamin biosynthesis protein [Rhizobium]TRL37069.1 cobalamin biosynthesis protein [Rhizobium straminoryzae]SIQ70413.1 cobalt-precorrin 5A hydrolase [Rhizobium sp. RU35A]
MMIAGIGCRRGTSAETVMAVLDEALAAFGRAGERPARLATGTLKANEAGLLEAAERLGVQLSVLSEAEMDAVSDRTLTISPHSVGHAGISSFCEAAALAAGGPSARLVGPRHVSQGVTCAIAIVGETIEDAA